MLMISLIGLYLLTIAIVLQPEMFLTIKEEQAWPDDKERFSSIEQMLDERPYVPAGNKVIYDKAEIVESSVFLPPVVEEILESELVMIQEEDESDENFLVRYYLAKIKPLVKKGKLWRAKMDWLAFTAGNYTRASMKEAMAILPEMTILKKPYSEIIEYSKDTEEYQLVKAAQLKAINGDSMGYMSVLSGLFPSGIISEAECYDNKAVVYSTV